MASRPLARLRSWVSGRKTSAGDEFSLRRLARENAPLAKSFCWQTNSAPDCDGELWLQLGCGERVLDGFVNVDFIPHDSRVVAWNLLDLWPESWNDRASGVFAEDVLEHFYYAEQAYILCNVNRILRPEGTARILMPSLSRLIAYGANYRTTPDEILYTAFGAETGGDALNLGMRFSGHRWLHDDASLRNLAAACGFGVQATDCATSTVARFNGLNLRDETNSLSFANDLRKERSITRWLLAPETVTGARRVEQFDEHVALYVGTQARPMVRYRLPAALDRDAVACVNIRSSLLSSFDEHNAKTLGADTAEARRPLDFDETLKSRPCMNIATRSQLAIMLGDAREFSMLQFSPAAQAGAWFTLGCAEVYTLV